MAYHFIGIGGIGMSALARLLLQRGEEVSGSDVKRSLLTDELTTLGARVFIGQVPENITRGDTVVYTTAIQNDNPEWQMAQKLASDRLHRSELLARLWKGKQLLGVAGTHGKTTTSALLASVFLTAGEDPSFAVGGIVKNTGTNSSWGTGQHFVAELDESDGSFLKAFPNYAILANMEPEHLDYFGSEARMRAEFRQFILQTENLFWCCDDAPLRSLAPHGISYGVSDEADLRAFNVRQEGWHLVMDVFFNGENYKDVVVNLVGHHNALNSLAVFGLCLQLGIAEDRIRLGLREFQGAGRRCDLLGEPNGILVIDDYAHHPTEIETTLCGVRSAVGNRRIVAVFQPHRYTRTADCLGLYGPNFNAVDDVIVTDIFAAGQQPIDGVRSEVLLDEIELPNKRYVSRLSLVDELVESVRPGDVIVGLGAGDITAVGKELVSRLTASTAVSAT